MKHKYKEDYYSNNGHQEDDDYEHNIERDKGFFSKVIPNKESRAYAGAVFRGFMWIFMLIISFLTIFLIFKTPYYEYYNQTMPVIIDEGGSLSDTPEALIEHDIYGRTGEVSRLPDKFIEDNSRDIGNDPKNTVEKPNTQKEINVPSPQRRDDNLYSNKEDTDITKILKKEADTLAPKVVEPLSKATPKAVEDTKDQPKAEVEVLGRSAQYNNKVDSANLVWVVNVYSTRNKGSLPERLEKIKNSNSSVLYGATFYYTEHILNGDTYFRISVVKNSNADTYPSYSTQEDAGKFCFTLKERSIDCFVSPVDKSKLPAYAVSKK